MTSSHYCSVRCDFNVLIPNLSINLYSVTNLRKTSSLSIHLIITSVYHQPLVHALPLCLSKSIPSKKPEPLVYATKGRKLLPARGKNNPFCLQAINPMSRCFIQFKNVNCNKQYYKRLKQISCINQRPPLDNKMWSIRMSLRLAGDIELNPGPEMILATQNCRGLKRENKLRQLLNRIHKLNTPNASMIFALQETHIEKSNLKYQWGGKHIFTPGNGKQGGIITLLSDNLEVISQTDIGIEAHIAKVNIINSSKTESIIIANIHAPCAHNQEKLDFFKEVVNSIKALQMNEVIKSQIIILGDFNLVYNKKERINTVFSKQEQRIGSNIKDILRELDLVNCWEINKTDMTWRHGEKMSRIDRILWSSDLVFDNSKITTDWTYTESDHAAVIVHLSIKYKQDKERIVRVDTRFMQSTELKHTYLRKIRDNMNQLGETNMDPHQKLEFLKMSIRSVALEIAADEKKRSGRELSNLKDEITFWQKAFENDKSGIYSSTAVDNLNTLIARRDKILNDRGEYLSQRMKTKWYQEGEKSTKYFLNLQRSQTRKAEMHELTDEGVTITDECIIKNKVEAFYKKLYEKGNTKEPNHLDVPDFLQHLGVADPESVNKLDSKLLESDLLETLNTCSDSAPGPDGIPYSLIKLTWNYYGKLLINSWDYAQTTGNLTHSHQMSYLRLIPKEGKDQTMLKNWRPITLSNCDFKIITKTLAKKLTNAVSGLISETQTAYIPGRQITDNLHLMLYATEKSDVDKLQSMLVSLDAEKAFDSVEHWYIREILDKLGLHNFKTLFNLMYKKQMVNIVLNGGSAGSYQIKNGVKQGDALSCILFILCMEPLIRNINDDEKIRSINENIPKVVAYADDITCMIKPTNESLKRIFTQYERLTNISGLKLNADKTEIITNNNSDSFIVTYQSQNYNLDPKTEIKVNGVQLGYEIETTRIRNIEKMYSGMEKQLRQWSNRGLSLIGKIQIFKTFGLSQLLYIGSVMSLTKREEKKFDELIYRFIWNRDMLTNKAPDRLKRSLLSKPIHELGFGMVDYRAIIKSIRVKTIIRVLNSENNPLKDILKKNLNGSWTKIKLNTPIRECLDQPIKDIAKMWKVTLNNMVNTKVNEAYDLIANEYIGNLIENRFRNKRLGLAHRHDTLKEVIALSKTHPIINKLDKTFVNIISKIDSINPNQGSLNYDRIPMIDKTIPIKLLSSKLIRENFYKLNIDITPKLLQGVEAQSLKCLGRRIKSLHNIRLKTILLRLIHGDVYCGTRMKKFGMTDTDSCPRCGLPETIEHMLYSCEYTKKLWGKVEKVTGIKNDALSTILGCDDKHDKTTLTLHAEILRILLAIDRPTTQQDDMLKNILSRLRIMEKGITKYQIELMINTLKESLPIG